MNVPSPLSPPPASTSAHRGALLAAAATGVQVGAAIAASRLVVSDIPPFTLAMLRYAIGLLCVLPFFLAFQRQVLRLRARPTEGMDAPPPPPRMTAGDALAIAGLGIGQFALLIALLNLGLQRVGAAPAALIFSLFPLLTLLLSVATGNDRLSLALVASVGLSIAGVGLGLVPKLTVAGGVPGTTGWLGEWLVLASATVGAVCSVGSRRHLRRYTTLPVSTLAMAAAVAFLAVLAVSEDWPTVVARMSPASWAIVGFIGVSSGFGYMAWLYALRHETPTRVTVFLALNPPTAALLGAAWLGEAMTVWTGAALVCIAGGLWLATRSRP